MFKQSNVNVEGVASRSVGTGLGQWQAQSAASIRAAPRWLNASNTVFWRLLPLRWQLRAELRVVVFTMEANAGVRIA
eukprot:m.50498 g.50498  ORF g.50498 m.50498 type:complete len:77 (-) comp16316_c1_seq1:1001-1231(-)